MSAISKPARAHRRLAARWLSRPSLVAVVIVLTCSFAVATSMPHTALATPQAPAPFGGSDDDEVADMLVLPDGDLIVVGRTESEDLPGVAGAADHDPGPGDSKGGGSDAFVARLSPEGSDVRWASYLGGAGADAATALAPAPEGGFVVVGHTSSSDFPVTEDAVDPQCGLDGCPSWASDAFVSHWSADGALAWATFVGGRLADTAHDVAVDAASGAIWIVGESASPDFPVTPSGTPPHPSTRDGAQCSIGYRVSLPCADAFVLRLSPEGDRIEHAAMIGGARHDSATSIELGLDGEPFVGGSTESGDFPTTNGVHDERFSEGSCFPGIGCTDAFVLGLTSSGGIRFATYLGGSDFEDVHALAVDETRSLIVAGDTASNDLPWTVVPVGLGDGHFERKFPTYQGFIARLSGDGSQLHDLVRLAGPHEGLDLTSVQALSRTPDGDWILAMNGSLPRTVRRDGFSHSGPVAIVLALDPQTFTVQWGRDLGALQAKAKTVTVTADGSIIFAADSHDEVLRGDSSFSSDIFTARYRPRGIGIFGRITDAAGSPLEGQSLTVSPARSSEGSPVLAPFTATSGLNGTWSMDDLPEEPLIVRPTGAGPWSPPLRHVSAATRIGIDFRRGTGFAPPVREGDSVIYLPWGTHGVLSMNSQGR